MYAYIHTYINTYIHTYIFLVSFLLFSFSFRLVILTVFRYILTILIFVYNQNVANVKHKTLFKCRNKDIGLAYAMALCAYYNYDDYSIFEMVL